MASPVFSLFSNVHLAYLLAWSVLWVIVPLIALRYLRLRGRRIMAIGLASITVAQEAVDYLNRMSVRELTVLMDLPLQFCHLAQIFSVVLLFFRMPLLFEVSYFWGLIGALQAMLTPDLNAFDSHLTVSLFFMHHGMLILIVLWLVFVSGYRCRPWAVLRTFLFTNFIMIPVGLVDWVIGANYMYLRASPVTDNPFISGGWPWYIVHIEGIGLLLMAFLQIPMMLARDKKTKQHRAERSFSKQ
ncbi:MAG: TIGR02206 family membrane protein [Methylococcales bacterium]